MAAFIVDEFRFDLPDGFQETTVAMWGDGVQQRLSRFAVVLTSKPLDGAALEDVVESDLKSITGRMQIHVLARSRSGPSATVQAIDVRLRTKPPGAQGFLYQRVHALRNGDQAVMLTVGASMKDRARCDAYLDGVKDSIKLRRT